MAKGFCCSGGGGCGGGDGFLRMDHPFVDGEKVERKKTLGLGGRTWINL